MFQRKIFQEHSSIKKIMQYTITFMVQNANRLLDFMVPVSCSEALVTSWWGLVGSSLELCSSCMTETRTQRGGVLWNLFLCVSLFQSHCLSIVVKQLLCQKKVDCIFNSKRPFLAQLCTPDSAYCSIAFSKLFQGWCQRPGTSF